MAADWRVVRSLAAKADLFEIWCYIAEHDLDAADRWLERVEAAISRFSAFPGLGSTRPELPTGVLAFSLSPYMILYKQQPDGRLVKIIRVIDARRDFSSLFL